MMFFSNPLNQFQITWIIFNINDCVSFYFPNIFFYFFLLFLSFFFIFFLSLKKSYIIPTKYQFVLEFFYKLVYDTVRKQVGFNNLEYFPLIFSIFFFILFSNLIGLIPYNFTITGHFAITLNLAGPSFIGLLLIGLVYKRYKFIKHFIPSDAPTILIPFITMIEILSFFIRPLSLAIRLFANMLAGHVLLFIMSSFLLAFINLNIFASFFLVVLIVSIYFLEFVIAILQSYVFMTLFSIYLVDSVSIKKK